MSCARTETQATVHSTATHQDRLKENCRHMERSVRVFFRAVIYQTHPATPCGCACVHKNTVSGLRVKLQGIDVNGALLLVLERVQCLFEDCIGVQSG